MSAVRLQHPVHGHMHAYSQSEIEHLNGLGWAVEVPAVLGNFSGSKGGTPVDAVQFYVAPEPAARKPGRPPKAK